MDAGIGKRARLEPGRGKTHAGSEPAPSASKGAMTELANVLGRKPREVKNSRAVGTRSLRHGII